MAEVREDIEDMQVEQKSFINDSHWKKISNWLSPVDPDSNHASARSKHAPTTGSWFLNGLEFKEWTLASNSMLWLHGIRS